MASPKLETRNARSAVTVSPRYQQVADDLIRRIGSGKYPVGGNLTTEMELCER